MGKIHISYEQAACEAPANSEKTKSFKYDDNIDPDLETLFNRNHIISRPRMELFAIITLVYCAFVDDENAFKRLKNFLNNTNTGKMHLFDREKLKNTIGINAEKTYDCNKLLENETYLEHITRIVWAPANLFLGPKNRYDDPSQKNEQIPISLTEKLFEKYNIVNRNWNAICQSFNKYSDGKKINVVLKANTIGQDNIKQFVNSFIDYINIKYTVNVTKYSDWVVKGINDKYYCFYYMSKNIDGEAGYAYGLYDKQRKLEGDCIRIINFEKCRGVIGNFDDYNKNKETPFFISK